MPTVLHVGPVPPPIEGGISAYLDGLLRAPVAKHYRFETFDVRVADAFRRHRPLRAVLGLTFLARYTAHLRRSRASLVHIHTSGHLGFWEKSLFGYLAARRGLPFVLHVHGGDFDHFVRELPPRRRRLAARVFRSAGGVIVLSEAWRGLFEDWVAPERLHVVPNAIHVADFARAEPAHADGPVRLLFVGMISARKGLDELSGALTALRAKGVRNFRVDIVGGEEFAGDGARYRELFRGAGLEDCVEFHGLLAGGEIHDLLRRAHVFVLPSRSESFGIANLEAMASGLPVVSTRTGAIPEYITDGEHGLLVEPGDSKALAEALRRLIVDPGLRERLGTAALERAQRYDWGAVSEQIESIYRGIFEPR